MSLHEDFATIVTYPLTDYLGILLLQFWKLY